jgi:hypothetical protein
MNLICSISKIVGWTANAGMVGIIRYAPSTSIVATLVPYGAEENCVIINEPNRHTLQPLGEECNRPNNLSPHTRTYMMIIRYRTPFQQNKEKSAKGICTGICDEMRKNASMPIMDLIRHTRGFVWWSSVIALLPAEQRKVCEKGYARAYMMKCENASMPVMDLIRHTQGFVWWWSVIAPLPAEQRNVCDRDVHGPKTQDGS